MHRTTDSQVLTAGWAAVRHSPAEVDLVGLSPAEADLVGLSPAGSAVVSPSLEESAVESRPAAELDAVERSLAQPAPEPCRARTRGIRRERASCMPAISSA